MVVVGDDENEHASAGIYFGFHGTFDPLYGCEMRLCSGRAHRHSICKCITIFESIEIYRVLAAFLTPCNVTLTLDHWTLQFFV
eukprot:COSAG02_NODE_6107_length_3792_cov_139.239784_4_plen_82_part_01